MKRAGFTMIEFIFVIVILGILAAVAIPKLSATRDDAQISKIASNIKTAESELAAYAVSQGTAPTDATKIKEASNVVTDGIASGYIVMNGNQIKFNDAASSGNTCVTIDVNATDMKIAGVSGSTGTICTGVKAMVKDSNISIAGQGVKY